MLSNRLSPYDILEYDRKYYCKQYGCDREGICRCSEIRNVRIKDINMSDLTEYVYLETLPKDLKSKNRHVRISKILNTDEVVDKYSINRVLTINKTYNKDLWDYVIESGYYGQEIDGPYLDKDVMTKISEQIELLLNSESNYDKIKYLLYLEYGFIPNYIKKSNVRIIDISKDDINIDKLNKSHLEIVSKKDNSFYSEGNYYLPRGVVIKDFYSSKYNLIDGYHRIFSMPNQKKFSIFEIH